MVRHELLLAMSKIWFFHSKWIVKKSFKPLYPSKRQLRGSKILSKNVPRSSNVSLKIRTHFFRSVHLSTFLTPPVVFLGLLVTLWTYKSLMLVLFQNKIIYMPSVPPFSRSEKIEDYAASCKPVVWKQEKIRAADGTKLALAVGEMPQAKREADMKGEKVREKRKRTVIVYFQG